MAPRRSVPARSGTVPPPTAATAATRSEAATRLRAPTPFRPATHLRAAVRRWPCALRGSGHRRGEAIPDEPHDPVERDALLRHRVAVAHRDRAVFERVDVHRDPPRRPDLVLAAVELADRRRVVIDRHDPAREVGLQTVADLHDLG